MKQKLAKQDCFMLLVKMSEITKRKGKEQLEELAKKDLGVKLNLRELLIPILKNETD